MADVHHARVGSTGKGGKGRDEGKISTKREERRVTHKEEYFAGDKAGRKGEDGGWETWRSLETGKERQEGGQAASPCVRISKSKKKTLTTPFR